MFYYQSLWWFVTTEPQVSLSGHFFSRCFCHKIWNTILPVLFGSNVCSTIPNLLNICNSNLNFSIAWGTRRSPYYSLPLRVNWLNCQDKTLEGVDVLSIFTKLINVSGMKGFWHYSHLSFEKGKGSSLSCRFTDKKILGKENFAEMLTLKIILRSKERDPGVSS